MVKDAPRCYRGVVASRILGVRRVNRLQNELTRWWVLLVPHIPVLALDKSAFFGCGILLILGAPLRDRDRGAKCVQFFFFPELWPERDLVFIDSG